MTFISQIGAMPTQKHWAIVTYVSTYVEGDERSRTNPGHGYPAHTVQNTQYEAFATEVAWKQAIEKYEARTLPVPYSAMLVTPARVSTSVEISIDLKEE